MKRTLTLGGIAVGLLATAVVASPAHADSDVAPPVNLANTNFAAKQVAAFWYGQNMANLVNATPYAVETTLPTKHVSKGGASADSKPGIVGSSGDKKASTGTSKNVNLPRTVGKVFFIGADKKPHWCSATAVQSQYKNLVATAGHCVYDTKSNKATLDNWVFIPGYYQGKAPWGIYVGKTAYTHDDFSVFEDGDKNYAFVTVYNGVQVTGGSVDKVKNWVDNRTFETKADAEKARKELETKETGFAGRIVSRIDWAHKVPLRTPDSTKVDASVAQIAVDPTTVNSARATLEAQAKKGTSTYDDKTWGVVVSRTSRTEFEKYQANGGWNSADAKEQTAYYFAKDNAWYKATFWGNFDVDYRLKGKIVNISLKDVGTLGSNVGGQGLAYNQKIGSPVFVFGYPSGAHLDGNYAFTGKTLKWSYGKTFKAAVPSMKAEEVIGVKSSFTGEGSLGSAWLYRYSSAKRLGYLNGVTITVSDTDGNKRIDTSVSPYFDGETYAVYKAAAGNWSGKIV
ncbi:hypothetical protein [Microbispora sp. NPDC046933]|uniref:trypsin-like serine peptidase n=1 Tax=Microbispora sp. NPDC046933 TaxID=3155618 RepID=UPI00340890E7